MKNKIYKTIFIFTLLFLFSCNKQKEQNHKDSNVNYQIQLKIKVDNTLSSISKEYKNPKTLFDIMMDLKNQNQLDFQYQGKDKMIFITKINGINNEGSGKNKKNWLYFVNNQLADKGISQIVIDKNTQILWCFTTWEEKGKCTQNEL
ncbi:MAG: hypothetical protein KatS3mg129_2191 [Leptospiraceae bacterium]|nr:MAG: hypothetical protein KatS3mg129_2191 [Leptospiraceae bacterium]